MKKISKLVMQIGLVAVMAFVLTACRKEQSVTYEQETSGIEYEITLHAKGDKVFQQILKTSMPYSLVGVSDKEEAKKEFEEAFEEYDEIEGVERVIEYSDDKVTQIFTLDLKKVDFDEIEEKMDGSFDNNAKKHGVSFKKTAKNLEEAGWTKK